MLSLGTSFSGHSSSNSVVTTSSTVPVETETAASSIFLVIIALVMLSLLGPTTGSALYVIAGVISIVVLIIIITLIVMVLLVATKRATKKGSVNFNSGNDIMTRLCLWCYIVFIEHATCRQPEAATNDCQEVFVAGVTSNGSSETTPPNREDSYQVTTDIISAIRNVCCTA